MTLSAAIDSGESLGRFLDHKNHFVRTKGQVRFVAFMPPSDLRLSVYRIDGLQAKALWNLGQGIAYAKKRTLYGVADIKAGIVQREGLTANPDNNPPRHAEIIGWPREVDEQLLLAQVLAAEAKLLLKP